MPQLRVLLGQQQGHVFPLGERPVIIGRHSSSDIILHPESAASRRHAEIYHEAGVWRIKDLGSVNGTELNGKKLGDAPLRDADEIIIGDSVFAFENKDVG